MNRVEYNLVQWGDGKYSIQSIAFLERRDFPFFKLEIEEDVRYMSISGKYDFGGDWYRQPYSSCKHVSASACLKQFNLSVVIPNIPAKVIKQLDASTLEEIPNE